MPMRQIPTILLCFLLGCGTEVDVGDNEENAKTPSSADATPNQNSEDTPIISTGQPDNSNGSTAAAGNAPSSAAAGATYNLTCFGQAPYLPENFRNWCENMDPALKEVFSKHVDYICNQRKLVNLTYDVCAWDGNSSLQKYKRTFIDIQDSSIQDYGFLAAYSLTAHATNEEFRAIQELEMVDPNFEDDYVQIINSKITNGVKHANDNYSYSVDFASSAATISFRGNLDYETYGNMMVVYDYDVADQVILKESKFLRFFTGMPDGTTNIIGIDEKVIGDGGNHAVSRQNVLSVLEQRMRKDYENSLR